MQCIPLKCVILVLCSFIFVSSLCDNSLSSNTTIRKNQQTQKVSHPNRTSQTQIKRHNRLIKFVTTNLRNGNITNSSELCSSSMEDFPIFLTEDQRKNGGFVFCFTIGIYCFTLLAIVIDKYFLPCVEKMCRVLNLSKDVGAAIFMSIATSCPELFTNIISTFITESDLGIGTIVGSSLFNALGVSALGGLAATSPIKIDWWPLTRDVIIYIIAIILLVTIVWDDRIYWYEGLILFIAYFIYYIVMFQNHRISKVVKKSVKWGEVETGSEKFRNKQLQAQIAKDEPLQISVVSKGYTNEGYTSEEKIEPEKVKEFIPDIKNEEEKEERIFKLPEGPIWRKLFFYYTWPIKFILFCTIPNPVTYQKLYPVTFLMSLIWIGMNSYVISWMVAIIGNVFDIPDTVLGLIFLAAGGCLGESISIIIMSRRGEGSMGVSNSMGANTMNILLSLGMPWFLKTMLIGTNDQAFIIIQSGSIVYTILALILVAITLYTTLCLNKFHLSKRSGVILMSIYLVFVTLAILSEMVFFPKENCS